MMLFRVSYDYEIQGPKITRVLRSRDATPASAQEKNPRATAPSLAVARMAQNAVLVRLVMIKNKGDSWSTWRQITKVMGMPCYDGGR